MSFLEITRPEGVRAGATPRTIVGATIGMRRRCSIAMPIGRCSSFFGNRIIGTIAGGGRRSRGITILVRKVNICVCLLGARSIRLCRSFCTVRSSAGVVGPSQNTRAGRLTQRTTIRCSRSRLIPTRCKGDSGAQCEQQTKSNDNNAFHIVSLQFIFYYVVHHCA